MSALQAVQPSRLESLAASIVEHHAAVSRHARLTLEHAIACGGALMEARSLVPDGQWRGWTRENVGMHKATVAMYIRIATFSDELRAAGVDTVQKARDYVRERGLKVEYRSTALPDEVVFKIRLLARQGVSHRKIASEIGIGKSSVGRIVRGERYRDQPAQPRRRQRRQRRQRRARVEIDSVMIEAAAVWLCQRYQLGAVTDAVRKDALELLGVALRAARR